MNLPSRDRREVEALLVDAYLEALLAAAERGGDDVPADPAIDPAIRDTAAGLRRTLVRVHPSFRFEERLARRLAEESAALSLASAGGGRAPDRSARRRRPADLVVPFARRSPGSATPDATAVPTTALGPGRRTRPLIVSGAVASAAISLAGAAIVVARRRGRSTTPMARAARAVHRRANRARLA